MINSTSTRERRDWTLLIFIIPIGVLLMFVAGQIAIRLVPNWSVNAGMQSNLDPNENDLPRQQNAPVQPVLSAILTPMSWFDTFLTPGAGSNDQVFFPPFIVFEPSATPKVTLPPSTAETLPSPTKPTATLPTAVVSPPPSTGTNEPGGGGTSTPPTATPPTATPPTATPPTVTPPTSTPPTSTPPTSTPPTPTPPTPTPPTPTPPTPTPVPVTSTPSGTVILVPPMPPGLTVGTPDASGATGIYNLPANSVLVIDLGPNPNQQLKVNGVSDTNYDLVYYEWKNPLDNNVYMDRVIIGISQTASGSPYYTVFNWSNGEPDNNSNVAAGSGNEEDNQYIDQSVTPLYGSLQTGITINVDAAPSNPPVGSYRYIVVQSPDILSGGGLEIDSIQVAEVSNPAAVSGAAILSSEKVSPAEIPAEDSSPPAEEVSAPPVDDTSGQPAEQPPEPPPANGSDQPTEEAPIEPPP